MSVRLPIFLGLLLLTAAPPASADPAFRARVGAKSYATPRGQIARVFINDRPVATLRTQAAGQSPATRAQGVERRLAEMTAAGLTPSGVSVAPLGRGRRAAWGLRGLGGPLLMVTFDEARAQGQTPKRLAEAWARSIKSALAEPALSLPARPALIPYGETRTLTVGGAALSADVSAVSSDTTVLVAAYDGTRRRLTLRAVGPGAASVSVRAGAAVVPFSVSVRRYAARVAPAVTVRVTGRPSAPASLVDTAVYLGLKHALDAEDGAQVRLLKTPRAGRALGAGASLSRRLPLRVAGPGLLPVQAAPLVTVINQPLPAAKAEALYYSNNPETVQAPQPLFSAPLAPGRAVRLDYHHMNGTAGPLIFHADAVNRSDRTVSVHVMSGVAAPLVDTVQVGRRAGAAFLRALDGGVGLVLEVPPHARVPLVVQPFAPGLTVSGIVQVRQTDGPDGALSLSVAADGDRQALAASPARLALAPPGRAAARLSAAPAAPLDAGAARATSPYVFGPPRVALEGRYAVGGAWAYLRLGNAESLRNAAGTKTLWGNYGVSYFVSVRVTNPTDRARTVLVLFAPEAGLAAGVFQASGEPVREFDPAAPPAEEEVTRVRLLPGQSKVVRLRTILLNGSAYPASLIVHAL